MTLKPFKIAAAVVAASATMAFTFSTDEPTGIALGEKAPMTDVSMKGTDDQSYTLAKLAQSKGLIVVFSCNTCPFVVGSDEFKGWESQYNELNKLAKQANIGFVLVNSNAAKRNGDDSMEAMKAHATEQSYTMPYVVDEHASLADAFGAKTTPHVYFFNDKMELIYCGAIDNTVEGKRKEDKNYLRDAISAQAAGKSIPENSTPPRGCSIKRAS